MLPEKEQKKLDEVTKCQVVCSSFRRKIKSDPDPIKDVLCDIDLNEAEMDLVEMAVHGSLTDDLGKKKCKCVCQKWISKVVVFTAGTSFHVNTRSLGEIFAKSSVRDFLLCRRIRILIYDLPAQGWLLAFHFHSIWSGVC